MPPNRQSAPVLGVPPGLHAACGERALIIEDSTLDGRDVLSRRHALLLVAASALTPWPRPQGRSPDQPVSMGDGFVVVDGWILPEHLFRRR